MAAPFEVVVVVGCDVAVPVAEVVVVIFAGLKAFALAYNGMSFFVSPVVIENSDTLP